MSPTRPAACALALVRSGAASIPEISAGPGWRGSAAPCWAVIPRPTFPGFLRTVLPARLAGGAGLGGILSEPGLRVRLPQPWPIRLERVNRPGPNDAFIGQRPGGRDEGGAHVRAEVGRRLADYVMPRRPRPFRRLVCARRATPIAAPLGYARDPGPHARCGPAAARTWTPPAKVPAARRLRRLPARPALRTSPRSRRGLSVAVSRPPAPRAARPQLRGARPRSSRGSWRGCPARGLGRPAPRGPSPRPRSFGFPLQAALIMPPPGARPPALRPCQGPWSRSSWSGAQALCAARGEGRGPALALSGNAARSPASLGAVSRGEGAASRARPAPPACVRS